VSERPSLAHRLRTTRFIDNPGVSEISSVHKFIDLLSRARVQQPFGERFGWSGASTAVEAVRFLAWQAALSCNGLWS
jgi:hypothetical protein